LHKSKQFEIVNFILTSIWRRNRYFKFGTYQIKDY